MSRGQPSRSQPAGNFHSLRAAELLAQDRCDRRADYLKGISTGDFAEALQSLVGERTAGLSANVVVRQKDQGSVEYDAWNKRDLSDKHYVYVWADGIYAKVRLEDNAKNRVYLC